MATILPVLVALIPILAALPGCMGGGLIIPLYTYPDSTWTMTASVKKAYPEVTVVAVINPNSGPGTSADPTIVTGIAALAKACVNLIGYVATTYGNKQLTNVKAEIDKYLLWYPNVTGIFLDEMNNTAGKESYYSSLTAYCKNTKNLTFVVGNPGSDTLPSYIGTVDTIVIYENSGLPSLSFLGGWHDSYSPQNFGYIAYGLTTLNATFVKAALHHANYAFITNGTGVNPYNNLPPYFANETAALQ